MDQIELFPPEEGKKNDYETPQAIINRHMQQRGLELERLQIGLSNLRDAGRFVYKVELRAPNKKSSEWLCLIKLADVDGAQIAFHSGGAMLATLLGVGRRLMGGTLDMHEDGYPPDDLSERLAYMHKNETWMLY